MSLNVQEQTIKYIQDIDRTEELRKEYEAKKEATELLILKLITMRALKLDIKLNIQDSLPILTDKSLQVIADQLIARAESLQIGEIDQSLLYSGNGYVVEFQFEEVGFSYKNVKLQYFQVFFDEGDENYTNNPYTESYQEILDSIISEHLYQMNDSFEAEYEESRMYQEEYY